MQISGITCAILEVLLYLIISKAIRNKVSAFKQMNTLTYYWFCFTVLTGIWEIVYLVKYNYVVALSVNLLYTKKHVWTSKYSLLYILPWKLSEIFYAEYGAYADREYMSLEDSWSHFIEGSHCACCGLFCLIALLCVAFKGINSKHYSVALGTAMGFQFMNSFLYMGEYWIQTQDINSVNYYNKPGFPLGKFGVDRPFMYVNIFWLIFPAMIICSHLDQKESDIQSKKIKKIKSLEEDTLPLLLDY